MAKCKRQSFSFDFKCEALKMYGAGAKPDEILKSLNVDMSHIKDKKHACKLFNRWKKELYQNRDMMFCAPRKFSDEVILREIKKIGDVKVKDKQKEEAFKTLKERQVSTKVLEMLEKFHI